MKYQNKGSVVVEFIILFPLFMMIFFAILQFGWLFYMRYQIVNVAFNSTHMAATNMNASNISVEAFAQQQLNHIGIKTATVEIDPKDIVQAERGDVLTVKIQVPAKSLVPVNFPVPFGQVTITVDSSVAKEY